jgi:translation initiation factor IF-1
LERGCGTERITALFFTAHIKENLPKEDAIEVMGKVIEKFRAGMFSIELDLGKTVLATMAGKLRRNRIKIMNGDRVSLELSPYDLSRGRITFRHR